MEQEHPGWELALSVFLILIGVGVWIVSASFPRLDDGSPGPALFPRVLAVGLMVGGGVLIASALRDLRSRGATLPFLESRSGMGKVFVTLAMTALVPFLMPYITLVGGAALASALFALLIGTDLRRSVGVGVVTGLSIYLVFGRLLGVPLS
ncbi:tripartite tricarboxylate transporter TctB family protein [Deinococcus sp. YIM 134068]|uniref:tripartite tricarboxylate transporter TctB family protein n=1 Tax=Deinococcus lichenicola TaxID=3118910 RepID=UPI002F95F616